MHGYQESTTHIRQREFGEPESYDITREEWEYLWERFSTSSREWGSALAQRDTVNSRKSPEVLSAVGKRHGRATSHAKGRRVAGDLRTLGRGLCTVPVYRPSFVVGKLMRRTKKELVDFLFGQG